MKQRRYKYHKCLVVIACIAFIFTLMVRANLRAGEQGNISGGESRPDLIITDTLKFDKPLHDLHTDITSEDCSSCHHAKGKEASCRKCHKDTDKKKLISMKNASHLKCIGCHREMSGPVNCNECHKKSGEEKITKPADTPVSTQVQPDVKHPGIPVIDMSSVNFDHDAHGQNEENCNTCHHTEELGSCMESCHTANGSEKGKMITAEQAMHVTNSKRSCIGCHEINKKNKDCAGCHAFMSKSHNKDDEVCLKCHKSMVNGKEKTIDQEVGNNLTADQLNSSNLLESFYDDNDIPEKVVIKNLSKEYGAVDLPHRKIVKTLVNNIKDNKLAGYFHSPAGTICQGCHHNSPISRKPPQCSNCHTKTEDVKNPLKPGIKGAFHLQCIRCHNIMKITKVDGCTSCHEENKEPR